MLGSPFVTRQRKRTWSASSYAACFASWRRILLSWFSLDHPPREQIDIFQSPSTGHYSVTRLGLSPYPFLARGRNLPLHLKSDGDWVTEQVSPFVMFHLNRFVRDAAASRITEYGMPVAAVIVSGVGCNANSESDTGAEASVEISE